MQTINYDPRYRKASTRETGWYEIRTRLGWHRCFYHHRWSLDPEIFVIEVREIIHNSAPDPDGCDATEAK